jgi:glycosyltransferase involved in cell wall biosynthesis
MPPGKVRVLRFITRLNAGGPARHVVWLSRGLEGKGYETMLVSGEVAAGENDLSAFAAEQGVNVQRVAGLSREIDPLADGRAVAKLAGVIREFDPLIVHTHTAKAGLVGRLAARLANSGRRGSSRIRVVHTFHGNVLSGYFPPLKERVVRWLERQLAHRSTDAIVVLSPQQRSEIVERFSVAPAEKVFIVPLALDLSDFEKLPDRGAFRREMGFGDDAFVTGVVGRIAPIKNHEMFLRAAAQTLRALPNARFVVIGDGEGAQDLERFAGTLPLGNAIRFTGLRTDLPRIYGDLDAVALTSRNEGTPLSLIEAMACGRPVVATEVGGVGDVLRREWSGSVEERRFVESAAPRGLLVPSGDVDGFAAALTRLEGDAVLCRSLGAAGRIYALRCHALPRLLEDLDRLYRKILA